MARRPRLALAGQLHHVRLRGHSGQPVFVDDVDRAAFLDMLREPATRLGVAVHAYALLDDEVHLLVTPSAAEALGRLVQSVGRRYVAAFNRRHQRRGTAWDGRFRNSLLHAASMLWPAMLLVETLPVRAGLAGHAVDWPWSSAPYHAGRRRDPLLTDHPLYWRIGNTPFERELAHTQALAAAEQESPDVRLLAALERMEVLGPVAFIDSVAHALSRPVTVRSPGRPSTKKSVPITVRGTKSAPIKRV
jgi:putative transposase